MKTRKQPTPLLSALAASMLCASLAATVSAQGIYQKYHTDGWGQPVICVLMQGLSQPGTFGDPADRSSNGNPSLLASSQSSTGELPEALAGQPEQAVSGSVTGDGSGTGSPETQGMDNHGDGGVQGIGATGSGNHAGSSSNGAPDSGATGSGNNVSSSPNGAPGSEATGSGNNVGSSIPGQPDNQQNPASSLPAEEGQCAFTQVPADYFDDALFIGDSRVTGVELYSGWDNLTYYAEGGMTIYNMFQSKVAKVDGQTMTIEEALQKCSFGKIYLEIGINEMGTGTVDSFMEAYEAAVAKLQELQPDAIIYVCGIMYVKQSKSESDPIFNNPAIQEKNDRIAELADGENIFYLDINEVVTDESGHLNPDYTWDEVHLLGKYDVIWLEYFSSHGIVKDAEASAQNPL